MHMIHTHVQTLATEANLDARGVEHDAAGARDRARRQILAEIAAHDAVVAVRAADLAPDAAELAVVDLLLRLVDVRHTASPETQRRPPLSVRSVRDHMGGKQWQHWGAEAHGLHHGSHGSHSLLGPHSNPRGIQPVESATTAEGGPGVRQGGPPQAQPTLRTSGRGRRFGTGSTATSSDYSGRS